MARLDPCDSTDLRGQANLVPARFVVQSQPPPTRVIDAGPCGGDEANPLSKDGPVCSMRERRAGKET